MAWFYRQSTGEWRHRDPLGPVAFVGYAGHGEGRNSHAHEGIEGVGPLPCGLYLIGEPVDSPKTGLYAMHLIPVTGNEMFGRSAFEWHGDNPVHDASHGCIVNPRADREAAYKSGDVQLVVVP